MIRLSIRRKIMGIAVTLIALMAITAVLTVVLVMQVGTRIEELTYNYMPAYGDLARANIRSLERALSIRRDHHREAAVAGRQRPIYSSA
jgi:adenylate cyclase